MRDPKRIDKVCKELAKVWKKVPDWRLCQLFANFMRAYGDIFYIDDDRVIDELNDYLEPPIQKMLAYYKVTEGISVIIEEINIKENALLAHINDGLSKAYTIEAENNEQYFVINGIKVPLDKCITLY